MAQRISALAPLRLKTFRLLWAANQISNFGGLVQGVGAAWMMTSLTTSASMIALVQASTTLPIMLFSLLAGALADSYDRRRIMLVAQVFMLAVVDRADGRRLCGVLTPWRLLGFTFLIGVGTALNNPSWQASMGDIVPRENLPEAVSLNSMGFNLMRSVGPAIWAASSWRWRGGGGLCGERGQLFSDCWGACLAGTARRSRTCRASRLARPYRRGCAMWRCRPTCCGDAARDAVWAGRGQRAGAVAADCARSGAGRRVCLRHPAGLLWAGCDWRRFDECQHSPAAANEWVVRWAFIGFALATLMLSQSRSSGFSLPPILLAGRAG